VASKSTPSSRPEYPKSSSQRFRVAGRGFSQIISNGNNLGNREVARAGEHPRDVPRRKPGRDTARSVDT